MVVWVTFHPDWYLDHRQSDWQLEEGLSWVKYVACSEGTLVYVHADYAKHIVDVLSWRGTPSTAEAMSKPPGAR